MKEKFKIKPPVYKWKHLEVDLQNFFLTRVIGIITALIVGIIFAFSVKRASIILFYYAVVGVYTLWIGYIYSMAVYGKIYVYEGVCEKKNLKVTSVNRPIRRTKQWFSIYGKCDATMIIGRMNENSEYEEAKFIVPIGYNYDVDETNTLRVYTFQNSVIRKNENTYLITNPLIVKVSKN